MKGSLIIIGFFVLGIVCGIMHWLPDLNAYGNMSFMTLCALLFLKFLLSRMYYVSCIQEGDGRARGCAGSSCLMTIVTAACIVVLTVKACRVHGKPAHLEQAAGEQACPSPGLYDDHASQYADDQR